MIQKIIDKINYFLDHVDISPGPLWYLITFIGLEFWIFWSGWPLLIWIVFTYLFNWLLLPLAVACARKSKKQLPYIILSNRKR